MRTRRSVSFARVSIGRNATGEPRSPATFADEHARQRLTTPSVTELLQRRTRGLGEPHITPRTPAARFFLRAEIPIALATHQGGTCHGFLRVCFNDAAPIARRLSATAGFTVVAFPVTSIRGALSPLRRGGGTFRTAVPTQRSVRLINTVATFQKTTATSNTPACDLIRAGTQTILRGWAQRDGNPERSSLVAKS